MSPSGIITIADTNLYNLKRCGKHDPKLTPSRMSITFPGNDIVVPLPLFSLASRLLSSSNRTKEERFVSDFAQWNEETTSNSVTQFRVLYQNWIYYSFNSKYKRTKKSVRSNSKDVKFLFLLGTNDKLIATIQMAPPSARSHQPSIIGERESRDVSVNRWLLICFLFLATGPRSNVVTFLRRYRSAREV